MELRNLIDGGDWRYSPGIWNELRWEIERGVEFAKESEMMSGQIHCLSSN